MVALGSFGFMWVCLWVFCYRVLSRVSIAILRALFRLW